MMQTSIWKPFHLAVATAVFGVLNLLPATCWSAQVDASSVQRGRVAFEVSCIDCHDADRALRKTKTPAQWLQTVRRMAQMDGAEIAAADVVSIATYLAVKDQPGLMQSSSDGTNVAEPLGAANAMSHRPGTGSEDALAGIFTNETGAAGTGLSTTAAISPLWRGGNDNLETPNFFVDAWIGADWQPDGPLRAKATACTSCHSDQSGGDGFTLELVEVYAAVDLMALAGRCQKTPSHCGPRFEAELKAGRLQVPFGAFSAKVHPGAHRAVTIPLMFNMGRRVNPDRARPPVLPLPYSDEGADLHSELHYYDASATLDLYVVNGLQGFGPGVQFSPTRSYTDNNSDGAFGTRVTVGTRDLRVGGSLVSGQMQDEGTPELSFHVSGVDAALSLWDNQLRLSFEYAIRRNDSLFGIRQIAYGTNTQLDALLWDEPNLRMLVRYDTLEHRDFGGSEGVRRFTWGVSTAVIAGTTLMVNHEHWRFSERVPDTDVLGIRWVAAF